LAAHFLDAYRVPSFDHFFSLSRSGRGRSPIAAWQAARRTTGQPMRRKSNPETAAENKSKSTPA
jgi:hypothetical protein